MTNRPIASRLSLAIAGALLASAGLAAAQSPAPALSPDGAVRELDAIVVQGEIIYRDRSADIAPTLSYDLEYFQRFEPLTVGDMLKRVPSVAFVSDVLEYDGAQLRGLDPGYTQILINGKKVPGAGADRSFFVDRIPAELVERIEIVRAPSANRSGDAVAGALNIVLRDAFEFDGAYVRAGALRFDDGEVKPTYGAVASGDVGGGRLLGGINVQGRYNPKAKFSTRLSEPGGDFDNREDQTDVRDGTDYSGNVSYTREVGSGELKLTGLYVLTDRTQTEDSIEYNAPTGTSRDNLLSVNRQVVEIDQTNLALGAAYEFDMAGGRTEIDFGYAAFKDEQFDTEVETGYDDDDTPPSFDEFEGERTLTDVEDTESSLKLAHVRDLAGSRFEFGLDAMDKSRDADIRIAESATDVEGEPLPPLTDFDRRTSRIDERRLDPYLMVSGGDVLEWQAGLRYETTDVAVAADGDREDNDYAVLLPSASLRWNLGEDDRLSLSLGRTVRRPGFDFVLPLLLEEEYGDNDFLGNPQLDPETAWGIDLGFERRLGRKGIVGVNLFYRDITDLIEVVNTGVPNETALDDYADDVEDFLDENPGADETTPGYPVFDPQSFVYTAANVGDGYVYGIEFDASTPLTALGLPNTGVFVNYSWLDSSVDDAFGERRFNNQARYVYNLGFIHDMPSLAASFGASYRKQGDAELRILAEEVRTSYGADLEVFIEKRFGDKLSVRLTGSNLLDASKDEVFDKFDNGIDQANRDYDEYELETESAGPVYQLIARYSF
ncbi:TonB-dependent receptor plug domain-containing protein [Arenimonas sp.]|uniref:TonB-dependent receptor plug domain-containing protein n=1 Tax=Arenimonas sp. TaxID=1872635 RepID=UPI002D7E3D69|nr:TonB-dependent receptor [Arenimonas sp.]